MNGDLNKIEKDLHSIDVSLGRIADALEKIVDANNRSLDIMENSNGEMTTIIKDAFDKMTHVKLEPCASGPEEEPHCPVYPAIVCYDHDDPDVCNEKCWYFKKK